MASNKQHILTLLALFSSWFFVGFSQTTSDAFRPASSGGAESFPCLQNLVHCQPYLKGSSNPTATCCEQLNETVTYDLKCLCDLLSNTDVLKSYNISSEEVNKLPKECGIDTKKSSCKVAPGPPGSSKNGSSSHNSTPSSRLKSAAYGITLVYLVWQFSLWL